MTDFDNQYAELENEFRKKDPDFLPTLKPTGPVDYIFIGEEPSLEWADNDVIKAKKKINEGFKNFSYSLQDYILHHVIRKYLCKYENYYITDLSKTPKNVKDTRINQKARFTCWYPLLKKEIQIVGKESVEIVAIGDKVRKYLDGENFDTDLKKERSHIIHYSNQNQRARNNAIKGCECEFEEFKPTINISGIIKTAEQVIQDYNLNRVIYEPILNRLKEKEDKGLKESYQKLAFAYYLKFQEIKRQAAK